MSIRHVRAVRGSGLVPGVLSLAALLLLAGCGGGDLSGAAVSSEEAEYQTSEDDAGPQWVNHGRGIVRAGTAARERAQWTGPAGADDTSAYQPPVGTPTAATRGTFGALFPWPLIPLHMVLLPDGRVLTYGTDELGNQGASLYYAVWNPGWQASQPGAGPSPFELLPNVTGTDLFCTTQLVLPQNGQVLLAGGDRRVRGNRNYASSEVNIFDPVTTTMIKQPTPMAYRRWYGTAVTTAEGEQVVLGGRDDRNYAGTAQKPATEATYATTPEVYTPGVGWRTLTGANHSVAFGLNAANWNYPKGWLAPDGRVVVIGNNGNIYAVTTAGNGSIVQLTGKLKTTSDLSGSVMYAPGKLLMLRTGGAAQTVDINGTKPVIRDTANNSANRRWGWATVLPDGNVWVNGGSLNITPSPDGVNGIGNAIEDAVLTTEMWSPETGSWTLTASTTNPRLYHNATLLLPSGAVLTGGGGAPGPIAQLNAEIYFPPYFYNPDGSLAERPQILSAPTTRLRWGAAFGLEMGDDTAVEQVVLVRFGASTHSVNPEQRRIPLDFVQSGNQLLVTTPGQATVAPPGYYMLFVLTENRQFNEARKRLVPSAAKVVVIG